MGRPKKKVSQEKIEQFQKELELAGDQIDTLLRDKKGRSTACLLCRRRKQKCDHQLPSCTACLKAAVKCVQPSRYNEKHESDDNDEVDNENEQLTKQQDDHVQAPLNTHLLSFPIQKLSVLPLANNNSISMEIKEQQKPNKITKPKQNKSKDQYTSFIEKKLKFLEKLIDLPVGGTAFNKRITQYKKITHLLGEIDDLENIPLPLNDNIINKQAAGMLPPPILQNNNGISASTSPTTSTSQDNSNEQMNNVKQLIPALSTDSLDSVDFSKCIFAKYNLKEFLTYDPAFEFDEQLSRSFLDTFFTRLQFKYPLLDEQEIYTFHDHYTNNKIHSYSQIDFHFASGRMWLVFSISACLHMTTGKYKGLPPVRYFSTAIRHISRCKEHLNHVQKIELLTLLVLYILRTDRDSLVLYEIIKDVMNICQNDLHLNNWHPQDPYANKKLRLFWCVYLLERMICVAVGKPYTIKESDINLPLFDEHSFNTKNSKIQGVHFINQSLKLRRIESKFVEILKILPNNKQFAAELGTRQDQLPLVKTFFHDLELWRASCSINDVRNFENETLKLYYYRSVRLLIQPYLEFITPEDRLFRECQAAAGQICQLYKIFHQKTVHGHSTPAVHTVFVAGVTLIYCMWLARNLDDERRKKMGDYSKHTRPLISGSLFSTMDDLRACSVCLYVMTERSKFARIFRDTFDQLMNATVGNLIERCGPDSSELIYISSGNYDVETFEDSSKNSETKNMMELKGFRGSGVSTKNNKNKNNGLPPATARTFGKRQADEHVGFVENSQVDLEEQKEFKKRQGMLEKTSVPSSLAHLLVKVEDEKRLLDRQEKATAMAQSGSYLSNTSPASIPMANQLDINTEANKGYDTMPKNDSNQYIIKKPVNSTEFDWKSFQQQAFLQQHLAQQNLQASLFIVVAL